MSAFAGKVAGLTGVPEERLERLAGGDLSEVLLVRRPDGRCSVAKGGPSVGVEAAMLRAIAGAGVPAPMIEGEHEHVLLLEHVPNDRVFSIGAWRSLGAAIAKLHGQTDDNYGWASDYQFGSVALDNRQGGDWPHFWGEQRLVTTARLLDRPWRERVERLAARMEALLPESPRAALLHGDLWSGNILVAENRLAGLIDPACYYGHQEVDLAMLTLFGTPPEPFWESYGPLEAAWEERRSIYQLFPALVHLRLFGSSYAAMVDRLLAAVGG
ncbi:MAG TPA: fructosamine kinase family protein [Allosphingosinicella sp.]|uniref:fructosamine kinase family protein n=1 Tax=Allosphingosinicella sp. TaxID=2823234 RepID=UPI002ED791BB